MTASGNKHLLLTGPPSCGKTTVIRRLVELLDGRRLAGFYTQERRSAGQRTGFEAVALSGGAATLADVRSSSRLRVGKYGVELKDFEALVREELGRPASGVDLYVADEIGKMECYSDVFIGFGWCILIVVAIELMAVTTILLLVWAEALSWIAVGVLSLLSRRPSGQTARKPSSRVMPGSS